MYREVVQCRSNYKKSYLWWFRNPARDDWTGSNQIEKGRVCVPLDLVWRKGEKGWCDLICVEYIIGLMVVLLMSSSRIVSMFFLVIWGVSSILGSWYGIWGQNYVALLQGKEMPAGFWSKNLILGISLRICTLNVCWYVGLMDVLLRWSFTARVEFIFVFQFCYCELSVEKHIGKRQKA